MITPTWRWVPPARSPLSLGAIARGVRSVVDPQCADHVRRSVSDLLAERFGASTVTFLDSGTSALSVAIEAALQMRGGAVAVPAYACFDIATAVLGAGGRFVLYDVDPLTLGPDLDSLRAALSGGVGAVVVAHLYGIPVDLREVRRLAAASGALVIEDAAQGTGGTYHDIPLGAHGDIGVLSFGRGKGLTGGGGGALVVPRGSPFAGHPLLRTAFPPARSTPRAIGATLGQLAFSTPALYAVPAALPFLGLGETHFRPPAPRTGMSDFGMGVLSRTLSLNEAEVATRRARAARYAAALVGSRVTAPRCPDGSEPGYLRYPVLVPRGATPELEQGSTNRLGIQRGYPLALVDLPGFGERRSRAELALEGAREIVARLVTLPTHSALDQRDEDAVVRWIRTVNARGTRGGT